MSKKELKVVEETSSDNLSQLKSIAQKYKEHLNQQYREAVAYVPDSSKVAAVSISNWLEMPKAIANAIGLPGLPLGAISQVYGKKDSGKTSILMQGIAACQKQGILPILILTEHKMDFSRLSKFMKADPEALIVLEASDLETGFGYLEKILKDLTLGKLVIETENGEDIVIPMTNQKCFVFWDSIGGTLSQSEAEGEVEDWSKDMGRGAQAVKKLVKRSAQLLSKVKDKVGIMFLNQVWTARTPTGISYDKPAGGEAVQHYYALEIQLKRGNEIKMTHKGQDMGIGYEIELRVQKNHISHNRLKSDLIAVAEGLLDPKELETFKKRYKEMLDEN